MASNENYQERISKVFKEKADSIAQQIANKIAVPSEAVSLPLSRQLEMWNQRQTVDPSSGEPIDPSNLLQQGMPIEQIVDLVYPLRSKMTQYQRPNPQDQVDFAEKMNKMSEE